MVTISRDSPCLSITAVAKDRLPVFRTDAIKTILAAALDEAHGSGGFLIFAYVIMPDHLHVVTDGALKPSDTLRFIKGVASRRIIQHLKDGGFHAHSKSSDPARPLPAPESRASGTGGARRGLPLVERAALGRRADEDEPLRVDVEKIVWRTPRSQT